MPKGKVLHIHHYFLAICVMSFISLQTRFMTVMHGFFHGMFIEGGARWGYDPIWIQTAPNPVGVEEKFEEEKSKDEEKAKLPPELLALLE